MPVDARLLELSREGLIFPQSPDEDMASRLVIRARSLLADARRVGPEPAALLAYLGLFDLARALLAAKGYRLSDKDPHAAVEAAWRHFAGERAARALPLYGELRALWRAVIDEPDMPAPAPAARAVHEGAEVLRRSLQDAFLAEFPSFRPLFRPRAARKVRTLSAERSFRDA